MLHGDRLLFVMRSYSVSTALYTVSSDVILLEIPTSLFLDELAATCSAQVRPLHAGGHNGDYLLVRKNTQTNNRI